MANIDPQQCGRQPLHPHANFAKKANELAEEALPISQQIENLRAKIALKVRYNSVLKEELEETREGTSSIVADLYKETVVIRRKLIDAVGREKFAVQTALRTHRHFQLALRSKTPEFAIAWLDDKLFDHAKQLNELVHALLKRREVFQDVEGMVMEMGRWPLPGSTPWEMEMTRNFKKIKIAIASMDIKLDTAKLLWLKYREILDVLRLEEEKYAPVTRNLETQLEYQRHEHRALQTMMEDALTFEAEAQQNLKMIENEATVNRRKRRAQMAKIKKATERLLAEYAAEVVVKKGFDLHLEDTLSVLSVHGVDERVKRKRAEIAQLEQLVERLVDTMRVPNLTFIPQRFRTVRKIGIQLKREHTSKEGLRQALLKERDSLLLILSDMLYTGSSRAEEFEKVQADYQASINTLQDAFSQRQRILNKCGQRIATIQLGMGAIMNHLEEQKSPHKIRDCNNLIKMMPTLHHKIHTLLKQIQELEALLESSSAESVNVQPKLVPVPERFQRVLGETDEVSDDEDFEDYKVPSRGDIKAKSLKFLKHALLQRGIGIRGSKSTKKF